MKNTKLITMIEGAIIAGICVALSYIPLNTANAAFDLSLGLIPLGVYALRRGLPAGMAVGFVWGLLLIVLAKAYYWSVPQVLLEYPIAFAFGGFGGIFAGRLKRGLSNGAVGGADSMENNKVKNVGEAKKIGAEVILTVIFAGIVAAATRWFFHFWAGVIFWGSYAPEGMSPYLYSFIANGVSAAANAAMLAVILVILVKTAKTLFVVKTPDR